MDRKKIIASITILLSIFYFIVFSTILWRSYLHFNDGIERLNEGRELEAFYEFKSAIPYYFPGNRWAGDSLEKCYEIAGRVKERGESDRFLQLLFMIRGEINNASFRNLDYLKNWKERIEKELAITMNPPPRDLQSGIDFGGFEAPNIHGKILTALFMLSWIFLVLFGIVRGRLLYVTMSFIPFTMMILALYFC